MSQAQEPVWNKESIQALLLKSPEACARALTLLLARQTASEQVSQETRELNNRGFTAFDAPVLTDIAKRLPRYNNHLTPNQFNMVKHRLKKYWRQILEEIPVEKRLISEKAQKLLFDVVKEIDADERAMQAAEAEADREQTRRDEANKHRRRHEMEGAFS
jgi:hypothetical protein